MDELRLVGVHDDGEHLVVETPDGDRHLLRIDQHLRGTVQRARRVAPRRQGTQAGDFGPRDIQARFRAGATVDEIVEESGWEAARVRRYEWPILAERAHIAREAQKVEVVARTSRSGAYRSVFDGEAQSLSQIVMTHAAQLGVATTSLDWDAWQRPDQQWQVSARFRVANPDAAPRDLVDQEPSAQWVFNPASLTVTPDNGWASSLTASPQAETTMTGSDSLFGAPSSRRTTAVTAEDVPDASETDHAATTDGAAVDSPDAESDHAAQEPAGAEQKSGTVRDAASTQETDELLDVLDARRGQRLGHDADSDDQLAEILGRSMGHVSRHPRPISAPQNSTLFDRPVNPAHPSAQQSTQEPEQGSDQESAPESGSDLTDTPDRQDTPSDDATAGMATHDSAPDDSEAGTATDGPDNAPDTTSVDAADTGSDVASDEGSEEGPGATIHHLGRADDQDKPDSPVVEITDTDSRPLDSSEERTPAAPGGSPEHAGSNDDADQDTAASADGAPQHEATVTPLRGVKSVSAASVSGDGPSAGETSTEEPAGEEPTPEQPAADQSAEEKSPRPRPRGRTGAKRSRSSVPSWDEIVFGAKNDDN